MPEKSIRRMAEKDHITDQKDTTESLTMAPQAMDIGENPTETTIAATGDTEITENPIEIMAAVIKDPDITISTIAVDTTTAGLTMETRGIDTTENPMVDIIEVTNPTPIIGHIHKDTMETPITMGMLPITEGITISTTTAALITRAIIQEGNTFI